MQDDSRSYIAITDAANQASQQARHSDRGAQPSIDEASGKTSRVPTLSAPPARDLRGERYVASICTAWAGRVMAMPS